MDAAREGAPAAGLAGPPPRPPIRGACTSTSSSSRSSAASASCVWFVLYEWLNKLIWDGNFVDRQRLDVPRHLSAVLPARRAAGEVRQGAEQPRRLHPRQPHRRRQPPALEGPAGDHRHVAGLAVLRRRARPRGRHRQHRQQDRRPLLRPLPDPRRQAAEARLRQRRVGLQRPAREPRLRRGARHRGGGDQAAGPLDTAGQPHRRRHRLRRLPPASRDGLRELPSPAAGAELQPLGCRAHGAAGPCWAWRWRSSPARS